MTTPEIEEIDVLNKLRDLFGSLWQEDKNGDPTWEVTVEVASVMHSLLHHQLQKARAEGYEQGLRDAERTWTNRYQSELDQDISK